ncbi:MAG: 2-dehydropantoate 2-reductase [Deltaproteobacteria bacterium]|jgi:2-dehydropantoate 2-reductase|nr:2-dehydropantoate 2-reductase [Deltaproteobacteria bacterium]
MEKPVRIYILGSGAMGGLYGGFLSQNPANRVTLICRRLQTAQAINRAGLSLITPQGELTFSNLRAVTGPEEGERADLLIVLVKAYDTFEAIKAAAGLVTAGTAVVSLQNGLGHQELLGQIVGHDRVISGVSTFGAIAEGPGRVILRGYGETVIGESDGSVSDRVLGMAQLFRQSSLGGKVTTDITAAVWGKLAVNAGINALAAILRSPNGVIMEHPETAAIMEEAVREVVAVGFKAGVNLENDDVLESVAEVCRNTSQNICSTLQDILRGRPTEIDTINGAVVKLGLELGVPTPVNRLLARLVMVQERLHRPKDGPGKGGLGVDL